MKNDDDSDGRHDEDQDAPPTDGEIGTQRVLSAFGLAFFGLAAAAVPPETATEQAALRKLLAKFALGALGDRKHAEAAVVERRQRQLRRARAAN